MSLASLSTQHQFSIRPPADAVMRFALVAAVISLPTLASAADNLASKKADASDESWMTVEIGGQPVGYEFSKQSTDGDLTTTESTSLIRISRFGQSFEMKTVLTVVDRGDDLVSFRLEQQTPGQPLQVSRGVVNGNQISLTSTSNGQESTRDIALPDGVLSPTAADRVINSAPPAKGESVTVRVFSVETLAPTDMTLTGLGTQRTKTRDGQLESYRAIKMTRSDLPLSPVFYLDEAGEPAKVDFGLMQMTGWAASREEALAAAEGKNEIDLGTRTVLKIAPKPGLSQQETAIYRVTGATLPNTAGSQMVTSEGGVSYVTVTTPQIADATDTSDVDNKYLQSTRWIDWNNAGIQKIAAQLETKGSLGQTALAAERLVGKTVSKKSFGVGFATASEVAATREGDCTEHGVLLAAVLRAAGLPARVCYGLVYVESMAAMVPHMWTEVGLDGQWFALDATRPGTANGGYLKFGDSALDSDASLPIKDLLRLSQEIETMEVRVVPEVPARLNSP